MIHLDYIKAFAESKYMIDDISISLKKRNYVNARALYCSLSKKYTGYSLSKIGSKINRNHATVLHSINNIHDRNMKDDNFYINSYSVFKDDNNYKKLTNKSKRYIKDILSIKELYDNEKEKNIKLTKEIEDLIRLNNVLLNEDFLKITKSFNELNKNNKDSFIVRVEAILKMMK